MFEDKCARCQVAGDRVRLFDVIYDGRSDLLCERCAIIENISIIKKPSQNQIKEADRGTSVYDRMKRLSGIPDSQNNFNSLRKERLTQLEKNPRLALPVKEKPDMVEYFHWQVMRQRRRMGLTPERLAERAGVPVEHIEMLEKAEIPDDINTIIKLEDFFKINLRKRSPFRPERHEKPVLLDFDGNVLDHIPEPEIPEPAEKDDYTTQLIKSKEAEDFDIHKADPSKVSLNELRELHQRRVEATREEKRQEQKKIEEKQKVIEARKEELRLLREKESKELDSLLGGSELIGSNNKADSDKEDNKIDKLFDEALEED